MINSSPITPPPELVQQWDGHGKSRSNAAQILATQAAQWGADQELQACINFVYDNELCDPDFYNNLRNARRPKPPSLKEQALKALHTSVDLDEFPKQYDTIRSALEALPND
jgi:hypothetical protein